MALNTLILVLASSCVTFAVLINECPPRELTTCTCFSSKIGLDLKCYSISTQKTLQDNLKALKGYSVSSLTLEHVNASTLPTDLFQGLHVKELELYFWEVDDASFGLEHSQFSGLENSLQWLYIAESFKRTGPLSSLKLDHLHSLKTVALFEVRIPEIGNGWITGPKSLVTLVARKSGIEKLGDKAFASLTSLRTLQLKDNHLKEISRSMFPSPANHLDHLDITQNHIRTLPRDIFSEMPALKHIYISDNLIHALPEDTWSPVLSQLKYLGFNDNPLHCDQDLKWACEQNNHIVAAACASPVENRGLSIYRFCKKSSF